MTRGYGDQDGATVVPNRRGAPGKDRTGEEGREEEDKCVGPKVLGLPYFIGTSDLTRGGPG